MNNANNNTNNSNRLKAPAIGLLIAGIIMALFGLLSTTINLAFLAALIATNNASAWPIWRCSIMITSGIVGMILSGPVIFGSISMLKQSRYDMSVAGSICAIVCGILTLFNWVGLFILPFGIWAIVALRKYRKLSLSTKTCNK